MFLKNIDHSAAYSLIGMVVEQIFKAPAGFRQSLLRIVIDCAQSRGGMVHARIGPCGIFCQNIVIRSTLATIASAFTPFGIEYLQELIEMDRNGALTAGLRRLALNSTLRTILSPVLS